MTEPGGQEFSKGSINERVSQYLGLTQKAQEIEKIDARVSAIREEGMRVCAKLKKNEEQFDPNSVGEEAAIRAKRESANGAMVERITMPDGIFIEAGQITSRERLIEFIREKITEFPNDQPVAVKKAAETEPEHETETTVDGAMLKTDLRSYLEGIGIRAAQELDVQNAVNAFDASSPHGILDNDFPAQTFVKLFPHEQGRQSRALFYDAIVAKYTPPNLT